MIKKEYVDFIIAAGLMAFGAFGTIYSVCTNKKLDKVCEKLNRTVDDFVDANVDIPVPDSMIEKYVEKAVDVKVNSAVSTAVNKTKDSITSKMSKLVKPIIDSKYTDIEKQVSDRINAEVMNMDMKQFKADVRKDARKKLVKKFDGVLDDLVSKFEYSLGSTTSTYDRVVLAKLLSNL